MVQRYGDSTVGECSSRLLDLVHPVLKRPELFPVHMPLLAFDDTRDLITVTRQIDQRATRGHHLVDPADQLYLQVAKLAHRLLPNRQVLTLGQRSSINGLHVRTNDAPCRQPMPPAPGWGATDSAAVTAAARSVLVGATSRL